MKLVIITDESSIGDIGSSNTVSILTKVLIPSVYQNKVDQVTVTDEQVQNNENVATVAAEKNTSRTVTTATTCMKSSM